MRDTRPLESARRKLSGAKRRINEMNSAINAYGKSGPCSVVTHPELDFKPRLRIKIERPPDEIGETLGDALSGMRDALDHIAWGFSNGEGTRSTKFPIAVPEKVPPPGGGPKVESGDCVTQTKKEITPGWSDAAKAFAKRHNPQKGDPDWREHPLVVLNGLVQPDKHQMIHGIGARVVSVEYLVREITMDHGGGITGQDGSTIRPSAQVLENYDDTLLTGGLFGSIIKHDVKPVAGVEVFAEKFPSEEIGVIVIRCYEAVETVVAEAERDWNLLVPPRN